MRRHFQVEPNGKHVRCAQVGLLNRCRDMLEDFGKVGVFPGASPFCVVFLRPTSHFLSWGFPAVPSARRTPRLLLSPSSRYYGLESLGRSGTASKPGSKRRKAVAKEVSGVKRESVPSEAVRPSSFPARAPPQAVKQHRQSARKSRRHVSTRDGLASVPVVQDSAKSQTQGQWEHVAFDALADSDDEPSVETGDTSPTNGDVPARSTMDVGVVEECTYGLWLLSAPRIGFTLHVCPARAVPLTPDWDGPLDSIDDQGVDFDALSTNSMSAWRALVDDVNGTPGSDEDEAMAMDYGDMWGATVTTTTESSDTHMAPTVINFVAGAQPCGNPAATLFPAGMSPAVPRPRSVTPARCPRNRLRSTTALRPHRGLISTASLASGFVPLSSIDTVSSPSVFHKQLLDASSTKYAQDVHRAACAWVEPTMPCAPMLARVTSTDSLFSYGDGMTPGDASPCIPSSRYGRRRASAGVRRAVAAVAESGM